MAFFVCLLLGVALPHRPGAELQVSGLFLQFMCASLHVLVVLLCVVVGASLISFLEFFSVFSSLFYGLFSLNCSKWFFGVFPGAVECFSFRFRGLLLLSYVVAQSMCVGLFVRVFEFHSMPTRQPTFNSLSADLFLAPSTSAPPSSGNSVAQALQQSLPTFIMTFRAENLTTPFSSAALPPVSSVVSSSAMVAASSLSSVAGTLRLLPFVSTFPAISSTPRLLLGLPGTVDLSSNYGITGHQLFFARRTFDRVMRQGFCGWPGSQTHPNKIGEENY